MNDPSQTITRLFTALSALQAPPPLSPPSITAPALPNILHRLTDPSAAAARTILLTLHLLFPHDFLPALDLLDRGLVNCFIPAPPSTDPDADAPPDRPSAAKGGWRGREREVFYVQSASSITESESSRRGGGDSAGGARGGGEPGQGRFRNAMARDKATDTFYEVRLDSWNCSCAAFAFQAFSLLSVDTTTDGIGVAAVELEREGGDGEAGSVAGEEHAGYGGGDEDQSEVREENFRFGGTAVEDGVAPVCKHILAAAMAKNLPDFVMPPGREGRESKREVTVKELAGWGGLGGEIEVDTGNGVGLEELSVKGSMG